MHSPAVGGPASPATSRTSGTWRRPRRRRSDSASRSRSTAATPSTAPRYGRVLQDIIHAVEDGRYRVNIDRTFGIDEIRDAHRYMEANRAVGKLVVLTSDD